MKLLIPFIILSVLIAQNSSGQDTLATINESWAKLKSELQKRTDIVSALANKLSKSTKVDKEQLNNARTFAIDLLKYIDTLVIKDSRAVKLAAKKNDAVSQALVRTIVTLEQNEKLMANREVQDLLMHLEGIENRIAVARRAYNDVCTAYKRKDLLFGGVKNEKAP